MAISMFIMVEEQVPSIPHGIHRQNSSLTKMCLENLACLTNNEENKSPNVIYASLKSSILIIISSSTSSNVTYFNICITQHSDDEELTKHIKTAHLLSSEDAEHVHRELFICDICNLIYFNKGMLALHMQQLHDPEHKFRTSGICPKCNKEIQIKHVWYHFQCHSIQSVACCPICLKKCKNRRLLQEHLKLHPFYYNCTICSYETKIKDNFTIHMQSHNSNLDLSGNIAIDESLLWRCFPSRTQMKSLRSRRGRGGVYSIGIKGLKLNDLFICVLCRGLCRNEEKAAHIARYHLVNIITTKKQYVCVCGEQFFNNVLLKHHVFKMQGNHRACD